MGNLDAKMMRPAGDKRRRPGGDKTRPVSRAESQPAEKSQEQDALLAELSYPLSEVQEALLKLVQQAYALGMKRGAVKEEAG